MKIYNKKMFWTGLFQIILGIVILVVSIKVGFDLSGVLILSALLVLGAGFIIRSCSRKLSQYDKLNELDERNCLIALKAKSKSFKITQISCEILMFACFIIGKRIEGELIHIGIGAAICFAISFLSEICAEIYYQHKS